MALLAAALAQAQCEVGFCQVVSFWVSQCEAPGAERVISGPVCDQELLLSKIDVLNLFALQWFCYGALSSIMLLSTV